MQPTGLYEAVFEPKTDTILADLATADWLMRCDIAHQPADLSKFTGVIDVADLRDDVDARGFSKGRAARPIGCQTWPPI